MDEKRPLNTRISLVPSLVFPHNSKFSVFLKFEVRLTSGVHWKAGSYPPFRTSSLRPATVSPTASASFNGICHRQ